MKAKVSEGETYAFVPAREEWPSRDWTLHSRTILQNIFLLVLLFYCYHTHNHLNIRALRMITIKYLVTIKPVFNFYLNNLERLSEQFMEII